MKNIVRNNKGQFLIEMVLMMIITFSLFLAATNKLREEKFLAKLIGGPWSHISGMLESGVWKPPEAARKTHPNQTERSLSLAPGSI